MNRYDLYQLDGKAFVIFDKVEKREVASVQTTKTGKMLKKGQGELSNC